MLFIIILQAVDDSTLDAYGNIKAWFNRCKKEIDHYEELNENGAKLHGGWIKNGLKQLKAWILTIPLKIIIQNLSRMTSLVYNLIWLKERCKSNNKMNVYWFRHNFIADSSEINVISSNTDPILESVLKDDEHQSKSNRDEARSINEHSLTKCFTFCACIARYIIRIIISRLFL